MSRFDEEPDGYIHGECSMEIERLRTLATCGCGDEFTAHDPGICVNCLAAHDSIRHAELETLSLELASCQAREAKLRTTLKTVRVEMDEQDALFELWGMVDSALDSLDDDPFFREV